MTLTFDSPRLHFRPLAADDLDLVLALFTDPTVMTYTGGAQTADRVTRFHPTTLRRGAGGAIGVWCLTDRASGWKLGTAALLPLPIELSDTDWDLVRGDQLPDGEVEIGYFLKPAVWGRGLATEACRRLLRFAFEATALPEVVGVTDPGNAVSQKVLRKSGMTAEGLRRAYAMDGPGFRITRAQWRAQQTAS